MTEAIAIGVDVAGEELIARRIRVVTVIAGGAVLAEPVVVRVHAQRIGDARERIVTVRVVAAGASAGGEANHGLRPGIWQGTGSDVA